VVTKQLTPESYNFLQRLTEIDFRPIAFKLVHPDKGAGLSLEEVTESIEQYRRFLFLYHIYPERTLVPADDIDLVWHTHILDTAKYREDCETLFGRFIDHYPYFGLTDAAEGAALAQAFAETQELYDRHFHS
jgi:hypothetical protein